MKVLILGVNGMLGQYVQSEGKARGLEVVGVAEDHADYCMDMTDDRALIRTLDAIKPTVVMNCAGESSMSLCEQRPDEAYLINTHTVSVIASAVQQTGSYLVHVSTDHYYTGDGSLPHDEECPIKLLNVYAKTKFNGEQYALAYEHSLVVRTNIVGLRGRKERTFLESALSHVQHKQPVLLFNDLYTSSIHCTQFASALFDLIEKQPTGIMNLASSQVASRQNFMEKLADKMKLPMQVQSGSIAQLSGVRCAESLGLDVHLAESVLGYSLPGLDEVVEATMNEWHALS